MYYIFRPQIHTHFDQLLCSWAECSCEWLRVWLHAVHDSHLASVGWTAVVDEAKKDNPLPHLILEKPEIGFRPANYTLGQK